MKISISTLRMHSKCTYMTLEIWCRFTSSTWLRLVVDTSQPVCISQNGKRLWTTSSNTKFLVNITPQLSKGIVSKLCNLLLQNLWSRHSVGPQSTHIFFFLRHVWPSSSFGHYLSLSMRSVKVLLYLHFQNMSSYFSKILVTVQKSFMGAPPHISRMLTTYICLLLLYVYMLKAALFLIPVVEDADKLSRQYPKRGSILKVSYSKTCVSIHH